MKSKVRKIVKTAKKTEKKELSVTVFNSNGKEVENYKLDDSIFTGEVNTGVLYQAVLMYNAKKRHGNASTKTRGDVSGGGKKPFRQKGTGRARAGSTRSPLWRHGGSIFGPHPRDFSYSIPEKIKKAAFLSSLNSKLGEKRVIGLESLALTEPKTKEFQKIVDALKLKGKSLFVFDTIDEKVKMASRNLSSVTIKNYRDFNTMDVLGCDTVVIARSALEKLSERCRGK